MTTNDELDKQLLRGEIAIKYEKPPIYDTVCAAFQIKPKAYFTYGGTIYVVDLPAPPPDLLVHESVHVKQQAEFGPGEQGAALWWGKYLRDPEFRMDQEARAYGKQFAFICREIKDRNHRQDVLVRLAMSLAGPLYNKCVTCSEAIALIKKYSGV